ncbi:MAG TPA: DUF433 domain-containing protein [Phycisphaerae bacterium]|nr:DUF433 domain-containing protein [Phycisphaerae bacterium]
MIDWHKHLTRHPDISGGQLCARGTRIPVTVILANLADGLTREQLQAQYPSLQPTHIDAALAYAADLAEEQLLRV